MRRAKRHTGYLALPLILVASGCSLAPKNFRDMLAPAPIVRARAVNLGENQPEWVAVPALIDRLSDPDPVVRMTADEALKKRTGQDFGFDFYKLTAAERQPAIDRWRAWWAERAKQAAYPKDDQLRKVAVQTAPTRRQKRRGRGQGGPTPWPGTQQSPPQPSSDPTLIPPGTLTIGSGSG